MTNFWRKTSLGISNVPFWLDVTLCCGQVFRWKKLNEWWYGVTNDQAFKVRQIGGKFEYANSDSDFVEHYFSLDVNLQKIVESINKDPHIHKALDEYFGLRLIRQDPWECLISYICATYKSIPAINLMLDKMSRKFGRRITLDGIEFYTFPGNKKLANANEKDLQSCGLGYRAKYILSTSKIIERGNFDLESLRNMSYSEAKAELMKLPGVGPKVADCILLFSIDKPEAFPVDIWIKRVFMNHYIDRLPRDLAAKLLNHKSLSNSDYEKINTFGREYFGEYAGYAQEYLYHYERMSI